jgi:hypothetical protein
MNRILISILLALPLLSIGSISASPAQNNQKPPSISAAIFAVSRDPDKSEIDPIVIIDRGRFVKPPEGVDQNRAGKFRDTPASARFAAKYYRTGHQYQLLFGGGKVGTVAVSKRDTYGAYNPDGCVSLSARVRLQTSAKIGGWVKALATDSDSLRFPESSRRAVTPAERETALELARRAYRQKGVAAPVIEKMKVNNLTGADLYHDGKAELIGSFNIDDRDARHIYVLFLIIEQDPSGQFKVALQHYDQVNEIEEDLVDYLDLDGDGIAEVITQIEVAEGWEYAIYKKKDNKWQQIYKGGGGGC